MDTSRRRRGGRSATGTARARVVVTSVAKPATAPLMVLLIALCVAALAVAGCGAEVGPIETITVDEPLPSAAVTDVELAMGSGTLSLGSGATGLASGVIRCNVADWQPRVKRSDSRLIIEQKSRGDVANSAVRTINEWALLLGGSPMQLEISAGAYEADLDLSGLTLQSLTIEEGAAKTQVMFNSPNPGQMDRLVYKTGASAVTLIGLANANFRSMEFSGGAGTYMFDFSGQIRTKATARVSVGTGAVRIQVPAGQPLTVQVSGSQTVVDMQGPWVTVGSSHSTPAVASNTDGKVLTVELEMAAGNATLVMK